MKKLAFIALAALTFTAISCKQEPKATEPATVEDSTVVEKVEVPAADSVEGVTVDSAKTEKAAEKDSVAQ